MHMYTYFGAIAHSVFVNSVLTLSVQGSATNGGDSGVSPQEAGGATLMPRKQVSVLTLP